MVHESPQDINRPVEELDVEQQLDQLERQVADLHRQIEQLQRLAALGTVASMVAHEFNNLLTPMVSYAQYALQRDEPALLRTAVEKGFKNAQRLTTLCQRVLGMAVDDRSGPAPVAVGPAVREAVECLVRDLEKDNIRLQIDVPEDLTVRARAGSLHQVLFNLVLNARQAMLDKPGRLRITASKSAGQVIIEVADTGPGIRPEHLERVFEPFFSTKQHEGRSDRQGVGLGLSICRRLMEEQGGTIAVSSQYGQGATFTLTFPDA